MTNQKTPFGFYFLGSPAMQDGSFEPDEVEIIKNELKDKKVFVDIGANVGYFTCLANAIGAKTISIEPLQDNLNILFSNLQNNNWNEAEVFPLGLGTKPGIVDLYGENTGASVISNWAGSSALLKRSIAISTLDIVLGDRFKEEKLFIKMDVEGYEYEVLLGAASIIARAVRPTWLIEICFTEHFPEGINPYYSEIFNLFWNSGYQAFTADQEQRIVTKEDVQRWVANKKRDFGYANFIFK